MGWEGWENQEMNDLPLLLITAAQQESLPSLGFPFNLQRFAYCKNRFINASLDIPRNRFLGLRNLT